MANTTVVHRAPDGYAGKKRAPKGACGIGSPYGWPVNVTDDPLGVSCSRCIAKYPSIAVAQAKARGS